MARTPLRALTFSNVCSFLALVVALGTGGAYAANTVDSHDIKNKTIRSVDIKDGQVRAADLGPGSVTGAALAPGAVDTTKIRDGQVTTADLAGNAVTGAQVVDGSIGVADLVGTEVVGHVSLNGIANGRCTQVTFSIAGAEVGQAAFVMTDAAIQNGIVLYAQRVSSSGHLEVDACNFSGTAMTAISDLPVRIFTLG